MLKNPVELQKYITVVIPAFNEENYIGGLLSDLSMQTYAHGLKIIVADGGSSDNTVSICKEAALKYADHLEIVVIKGGTVTQGRNAGLELTKTGYVLFIDADVRLSNPFQIYNVWHKLGTRDIKLVGAKIKSNKGIPSGLAYKLFNFINVCMSQKKPFAIGSFFGTHTEVICKKGKWDETLMHGEDWVLSRTYKPKEFSFCSYPIYVDDRRFKKTGYFGMLKLMLISAWKGPDYMRKDHGYWK